MISDGPDYLAPALEATTLCRRLSRRCEIFGSVLGVVGDRGVPGRSKLPRVSVLTVGQSDSREEGYQ